MSTLAIPRAIIKCKTCKVTFVPEVQSQNKCTNCIVREEIEAKIKARVKSNA